MTSFLRCMTLLVASLTAIRMTSAQEFRIYTRISMAPAAPPGSETWSLDASRPEVLARSLTLFHAGRVYDYIDTAGEVLVFEPAHRRFTILNTQRELATTVEFDELTNLLKVARRETENYATRLRSEPDAGSRRTADQIQFQLDPRFDETWDQKSRRLTLSGKHLRYQATVGDEPSPEVLEAWSRYADAMCRLNFVLHPGAVFPESRLALNAALVRQGGLPTSVELMADTDTKIHLRAEHQFHWELDARDRSLMHSWETLLAAKGTRRVSFHEYQRAVAAATRSR